MHTQQLRSSCFPLLLRLRLRLLLQHPGTVCGSHNDRHGSRETTTARCGYEYLYEYSVQRRDSIEACGKFNNRPTSPLPGQPWTLLPRYGVNSCS